MINHLLELLRNDLYKHQVVYGPINVNTGKEQKIAFFKNVKTRISEFIPQQVPEIIPDSTMHPEFKIVVDFTHQFTMNAENENISGKRILSQKRLENIAKRIQNFIAFYFDYPTSYKDKDVDLVKKYIKNLDVSKEEAQNLLLNTIINIYATSVSVTRNRNSIGNATFTLHESNNYVKKEGNAKQNQSISVFIDKNVDILNQMFAPMLPIMIWAKGRFYKDVWIPIFDGYIIYSSVSNSKGLVEITVTCKDTLELARITQEMVNPSIIQVNEFNTQGIINIFAQPLFGLDHYEIFKGLFHGGAVIWDSANKSGRFVNWNDPEFKAIYNLRSKDKNKFLNFSALGSFNEIKDDPNIEEISRVAEERVIHKDNMSLSLLINKVSHKQRKRNTIFWGEKITPFRIFNLQNPNIYVSGFDSRLAILQKAAEMTYYDFYVDGYGDVQYHPMRFSSKYLLWDIIDEVGYNSIHANIFPGSQVIGKDELLSTNTSLNIEEMVTYLKLYGYPPLLNDDYTKEVELSGYAVDQKLMERFGYRRKEIRNELFGNNPDITDDQGNKAKFLNVAADSLLHYVNGELYTRTSTIVFRPELEISMPVMFTDDNTIFYVQSITHNITVGGDATTTINANYGRKDSESALDLETYVLDSEASFKTFGKINNFEEYKELVLNNTKIPFVGHRKYKIEKSEEEDSYYEGLS